MPSLLDSIKVGDLQLPNRVIMVRESIGSGRIGPQLKAAFGRVYIANPDLPRRFAHHLPSNIPRPELFYTSGPEGYLIIWRSLIFVPTGPACSFRSR